MSGKPASGPAAGDAPPPSPDRGAAREKLMAYLAWGVAEGAITEEQAGQELARFDAEGREADPG